MAIETVLVVDDSATHTQMICDALNTAGFKTLSASSAEDAVALAQQERPDAVLMDVIMPEMNGYEAIRLLQKSPETKDIPVVIVSSKDNPSDKVWGMRQGAAAYITKPFSNDELVAKLRSLG